MTDNFVPQKIGVFAEISCQGLRNDCKYPNLYFNVIQGNDDAEKGGAYRLYKRDNGKVQYVDYD